MNRREFLRVAVGEMQQVDVAEQWYRVNGLRLALGARGGCRQGHSGRGGDRQDVQEFAAIHAVGGSGAREYCCKGRATTMDPRLRGDDVFVCGRREFVNMDPRLRGDDLSVLAERENG